MNLCTLSAIVAFFTCFFLCSLLSSRPTRIIFIIFALCPPGLMLMSVLCRGAFNAARPFLPLTRLSSQSSARSVNVSQCSIFGGTTMLRKFAQASSSSSRVKSKQLVPMGDGDLRRSNRSQNSKDLLPPDNSSEFPMDQYKYIAHLLMMPIRTPEATRKVCYLIRH